MKNKKIIISDDFGLRWSVIHKTKKPKSVASIVARVVRYGMKGMVEHS